MLDKHSPLCCRCCDAECWGSCVSDNSFSMVSLALRHQRNCLPETSYWAQKELRTMIATWSLRMFNSYNSHRECKEDLETLAHLLLYDIQEVIGRRPGNLRTILFGPEKAQEIQKLDLKHVALGLGAIERDFRWLVESRPKAAPCKKRTLAQENVEGAPKKKSKRTKTSRNSQPVFQNMERVEEEKKREAEERISFAYRTSLEPPNPPTRPGSVAQTEQPHRSSPALSQRRGTLSIQIMPPVSPASSRSTSPRSRLPDSPTQMSRTAAPQPGIQGTTHVNEEPVNESQTASPKPSNEGTILRTWEELAHQPTPQWAVVYEEGHLPDLGLTAGDYNVSFSTPVGKYPAPARTNSKGTPSFQWLCWQILRQIPGGRMKTKALSFTVMEWTDRKFKENTCKQRLSTNKCEFLAQSSDKSNQDAWRFLKDLPKPGSKQAAAEPEQPPLSQESVAQQATAESQHSSSKTPPQTENDSGYGTISNHATPSSYQSGDLGHSSPMTVESSPQDLPAASSAL